MMFLQMAVTFAGRVSGTVNGTITGKLSMVRSAGWGAARMGQNLPVHSSS
jgi:hypothetical protein